MTERFEYMGAPWTIPERVAAGRDSAVEAKATQHKPYGQTSEDVYPYTYWWIKGYNDAVDEAG